MSCLDIAFKRSGNLKANVGTAHGRERAQYQHESDFKQGRIVGFWKVDLSYHDILTPAGHAAMAVMRVWNQWVEDGRTQKQALYNVM